MASAPIFRWAGSKRKLLPILRENVALSYRRYVEPFAGSACLFFDLEPSKAILGDFNIHLIEAYREIASSPEQVYAQACSYSCEEAEYYRVRALSPAALSPVQRAARFLYLNRYCFNGVYRTNRSGTFNVPRGRDTGGMPSLQSVLAVSKALRSARLVAGDFRKVLKSVESEDFVYLDPPYAKKDEKYSGEYGYGAFSSIDLPSLISELQELDRRGAIFLLSYRYTPQLRRQFKGWHSDIITVRRNVAGFGDNRTLAKEILLSNRPLRQVHLAR